MSRHRFTIAAALGLLYGLVPEYFAGALGVPVSDLAADLVVGVAAIWVGVIAWRYRPDDNLGRLLCLLGVVWFFGSYGAVPNAAISSLGTAFQGYQFLVVTILVVRELRSRTRSWLEASRSSWRKSVRPAGGSPTRPIWSADG